MQQKQGVVDDATQSGAEAPAGVGVQVASARMRTHAVPLGGAALVLVVSGVLAPSDTALSLMGWELPPLCAWKNATGWDCLGCGLTRSFVWMGHGNLRAAFGLHALGPVLYLAVLLQVPLRLWRLWQLRSGVVEG